MIKLFDYIKILFGSDAEWDKLTSYDKSKNIFMTNRFMSIKWPIQAQLFNKLKTDPVGTSECWRIVGSKFNRVPGFIYTKVKTQPKKNEWHPDQKYVDVYMKINEIGEREFKEALKFNPSQIKAAIDKIQKQMGHDNT